MDLNELAGIDETTLSRVYRHFKNDNIPVVVITAFRSKERSKEQNIALNKQIAREARKAGYGYVFLDGAWQDPKSGEELTEDSVLIIGGENDNGKLKGMVKKWIVKYNQDAALWKEEGQGDIALLFQNGSTQKLGAFSPKALASGYTKLRGRGDRTFVFEHAHGERNWISRWAEIIRLTNLKKVG